MGRFFSYDAPFWKIMGRVADLFLLSVLWMLFSIPIVTMGAATCALSYVTLKIAENREEAMFKSFVKAFKDNLKNGTIVYVILAFLGGILVGGAYGCYCMQDTIGKTLIWVFIVNGILFSFLCSAIFPLCARLDVGVGKLFAMSFMVCVKHFSWILFTVVMSGCLIAVGIFVFWPVLFWLPGTISMVQSYTMAKVVFPKYKWNSED